MMISILSIVIISLTATFYSVLTTIEDDKVRDIESLFFLELEVISKRMEQNISHKIKNIRQLPAEDLIDASLFYARIIPGSPLKFLGGSRSNLTEVQNKVNELSKDLKKSHDDIIRSIRFIAINGKKIFLINKNPTLFALPLDQTWEKIFKSKYSHNYNHFIITRWGDVLYSNRLDINEFTLEKRSLVQNFIGSKLTMSSMKIKMEKDFDGYGFFHEFSDGELINMIEVEEKSVLSSLSLIKQDLYTIALWATLGTFIGILIIGFKVSSPIVGLIKNMQTYVNGNEFKKSKVMSTIGELKFLQDIFNALIDKIRSDKIEIESLHAKEIIKVEMEQELNVINAVQNNFFNLDRWHDHHWECTASLVPATQASGDWFTIGMNKNKDILTIAIADVVGHGAGSAMFTAVIASHFTYYHDIINENKMRIIDFFNSLNKVFCQLGQDKWLATLQVIQDEGDGKITIYNAGHPPPFIYRSGEVKKKVEIAMNPSNLIGSASDLKYKKSEHTLNKGDYIFLYSDGVIECSNTKGKQFGSRRLKNLITEKYATTEETISTIKDRIQDFNYGPDFDDDCTMIALKRIA